MQLSSSSSRGLFKKIRDTKGTSQAKIGPIKDRNGMDLTEAEDIKKTWQEYTEELYKKDVHDPDNHHGGNENIFYVCRVLNRHHEIQHTLPRCWGSIINELCYDEDSLLRPSGCSRSPCSSPGNRWVIEPGDGTQVALVILITHGPPRALGEAKG